MKTSAISKVVPTMLSTDAMLPITAHNMDVRGECVTNTVVRNALLDKASMGQIQMCALIVKTKCKSAIAR